MSIHICIDLPNTYFYPSIDLSIYIGPYLSIYRSIDIYTSIYVNRVNPDPRTRLILVSQLTMCGAPFYTNFAHLDLEEQVPELALRA